MSGKKSAWDRKKILELELTTLFHYAFLQEIGFIKPSTDVEILSVKSTYGKLRMAVFFRSKQDADGFIQLARTNFQKYQNHRERLAKEWENKSRRYRNRLSLSTVADLLEADGIYGLTTVSGSNPSCFRPFREKSVSQILMVLEYLNVNTTKFQKGKSDKELEKVLKAAKSIKKSG